ncbi:MAG: DUF4363 family protein [Clostridia bacterium]|nr:DUF4363 family protein [Clostridia bacterium]
MNKLLCGLIIITATLLLCFASFKTTNSIAKKSIEYIEKIENSADNNKNTEYSTNDFEEFWDKKSKILQILIHHEQIDDIDNEISKLKISAKEKNKFEILKTCNCLKSKFESLEKIDEISIENIL